MKITDSDYIPDGAAEIQRRLIKDLYTIFKPFIDQQSDQAISHILTACISALSITLDFVRESDPEECERCIDAIPVAIRGNLENYEKKCKKCKELGIE